MKETPHLLIVDDDLDMGLLLDRFFAENGFTTHHTTSGQTALQLCKEHPISVALCDFRLPDIDGMELLKKIRTGYPNTQVIIITGYSDVRIAVRAIKFGAFDYVTKPLVPEDILDKVKAALDKGKAPVSPSTVSPSPDPVKQPKAPTASAEFLRGQDPKSQKMHEHIELVAPTEMTVLVHGETGAGKERVARLVHEHSTRSNGPFQALDCGALPDNLAGSELFGHKKGAFTGALMDKKGYFESANGGTLFLDEIGNLSYEIQVQLLRVLQERSIRRLGETQNRKVNVRLVAATHENLRELVEQGDFREDLYHRLNEFELIVPPLRERGEDIMRFAEFFLARANAELNTRVTGFSSKTREIILRYEWPGNLREMRNVIRRATLLARNNQIQPEHFPREVNMPPMPEQEGELKSAALEAEREVILQALKATNYNKSQAARDLNIDRKTLYNKIKTLGLEI